MNTVERIPTDDDIKKLPRLAMVAFAARCARRVLPIYEAYCLANNEDPSAVCEAVTRAEQAAFDIEIARAYASTRAVADIASLKAARHAMYTRAEDAAKVGYEAARAVAYGVNAPHGLIAADAAVRAAEAAAAVGKARAAAYGANAANAARRAGLTTSYADAVKAAAYAVRAAAYADRKAIPEIWRDCLHVLEVAKKCEWTDETSVTPLFFGPIWPEG